jgi:hypothetical protein
MPDTAQYEITERRIRAMDPLYQQIARDAIRLNLWKLIPEQKPEGR